MDWGIKTPYEPIFELALMGSRSKNTPPLGRLLPPGAPPSSDTLAAARKQLARRITELRNEARLSQRQAAARAGMDHRNWGRIEAEELNPRLDSLLKVQHALGVDTLEALLGPLPGRQLLDQADGTNQPK